MTAYSEVQARNYDRARFATPQGRLIHWIEDRQVERAVSYLAPGARVLEIGAGTARFAIELAKQGFNVTALDPSEHMLEEGKSKARDLNNLSFVVRSGQDTGFDDGAFDFVFSTRVLNRLGTKQAAIDVVKEKMRVVAPGGYVLIDFATSGFPLPRPGHPPLFSFKELAAVAIEGNCEVLASHGYFLLSSHFISALPKFALPAWKQVEMLSSKYLPKLGSKGSMLLRKRWP